MPRIIESTFSNASIESPFQRKVFKRANRYYLFWADRLREAEGEAPREVLLYRVADSIAGLVQAQSHVATSRENSGWQYGQKYDVHYDHEHDRVGIAWSKKYTQIEMEHYFKYGTFAADGKISWQAEHPVAVDLRSDFRDPNLARSANGKWGILVRRATGSDIDIDFFVCDTGTPTATSNWSLNENVAPGEHTDSFSAHRICQLGLQGDDMLIFYKIDDNTFGSKHWNGTALDDEKVVRAKIDSQELSDPVMDAEGKVHVTYLQHHQGHHLKHAYYDPQSESWTADQHVDTVTNEMHGPSMQLDGNGGMHVFLKNAADDNLVYCRWSGGSWSNVTSELTGDLAGSYSDLRESPTVAFYDPDEVLVAWINENGNQNELWMNGFAVSVQVEGPVAAFEGTPRSVEAGMPVQFQDKSTKGTNDIQSWHWDFGDGGSSTEQNPEHTYKKAGSYDVSLTVSDGTLSDTATQTGYVTVTEIAGPVAAFEGTPRSVEAGMPVQFQDKSTKGTNDIQSWHWDFGDGGSSTEQNPEHTYKKAGSYDVSLTVSDGTLSDTATQNGYVTVTEVVAPSAAFDGEPRKLEAGSQVKFTDKSRKGSHDIQSWQWDFGDGGSSSEQHPTHVYNAAGSYAVSLTVSDGKLNDTARQDNYVLVTKVKVEDECKGVWQRCVACYILGWLTGIGMLAFEKRNRCVRFHAWQSILVFLPFTLLMWILYQFVPPNAPVLWGFRIVFVLIYIWLIFKAAQGIIYRFPIAGNIAYRKVFGDD